MIYKDNKKVLILLQCIYFLIFHFPTMPDRQNIKPHAGFYSPFPLRKCFFRKKNSGEAARAPATIPPAGPPLPAKKRTCPKQVRLFFPQIDRGRFSRYFLETATEIFRIGVPDFISDLRHRKFSCLHQLYGTFDTYHL